MGLKSEPLSLDHLLFAKLSEEKKKNLKVQKTTDKKKTGTDQTIQSFFWEE